MASININNVIYALKKSFKVDRGRLFIDGKDVTPNDKVINVSIEGDVQTVEVGACEMLTITGSVQSVKTGSGSVSCSSVNGPVTTGSGDVECSDISGNVSTGSGDVTCVTISGSVRTGSGDIRMR